MLQGRRNESAILASLLDGLRVGRSGVLVVRGEAGIGKTALLEEAVASVVREGKNFKGRVLGFVLGTMGKPVLERAFVKSVKAIEALNAEIEDAELGQMEIDEEFAEVALEDDSA